MKYEYSPPKLKENYEDEKSFLIRIKKIRIKELSEHYGKY